MSWVLAVDFGTSNTAAAHRTSTDQVQSLPLSHTSDLMSSAVHVENPQSVLTGDVARNRADIDPAGYIAAPKQHVAHGSVVVRGAEMPTSVAIAAVLATVYATAVRRHNGERPSAVVLTHPEAWSPRELSVLRDAAARAGLGTRVELISEPRAAAFYYSRRHDARIVNGSTIAVFDFGGGTLDVAVLAATSEHTFEILDAGGDNTLGGKNLDATVAQWVDRELYDQDPDLATWLRSAAGTEDRHRLDDQIRHAKELLSESPSATIRASGNGGAVTLQLTRDEFERMIEPRITRAVHLAQTVLNRSGVDRGGLQALYLTGGSSRIPYVHRRLSELAPVATLDDPKTVVAKGAAEFVSGGRETTPPHERDTAVLPHRPGPPPAAETPTRQAGRTRLLALAGVAVLAVVAGGGYLALRGDGGATATGATVAAPTSAGAEPATSDSRIQSKNTEDVTSLLPASFLSVSTCSKSSYSSSGALEVRCTLDEDSSLARTIGAGASGFSFALNAFRDDQYTRSTLLRFHENTSDYTTAFSADGSRAISYDAESPSALIDFVDSSNGLAMTLFPDSIDEGLAFLDQVGLAP